MCVPAPTRTVEAWADALHSPLAGTADEGRAVVQRLRPGAAGRIAPLTGERRKQMPRYVVERAFPEGLRIPAGEEGAEACRAVVERNADEGVTWVHSYVSND